MEFQFDILSQSRSNLLALLAPFTHDELNQIPSGFKNNLAWNLGHVIVSQQLLCYKLSGLPLNIPQELVEQFRRGTIPLNPLSDQEINRLKSLATQTADKFREDYNNGLFEEYQGYQSLYGVKLESLDDAIVFNNTHEGLHLGYVMAMRKLIA
jgi:hypothetical protein